MIGDIYQILNNQDTSVCAAMQQIKGPTLCQHRCSYYSLSTEKLTAADEHRNGRQSLVVINT